MAARYMTLFQGARKLVEALVVSVGSADAGKIVALDSSGRLNESLMPLGVGADTVSATASETIGAGKFVNFHDDAGTFSVRLADNSNGRRADGFVQEEVTAAGVATVYPMDGTNAALTGLAVGARYWLGTAGGVIAAALDETDALNANKISQFVGTAKSSTELVTDDSDPVTL